MSEKGSYEVLHNLPDIEAKDKKDLEEGRKVEVTPKELPVATPEQARNTIGEIKKALGNKGIDDRGGINSKVANNKEVQEDRGLKSEDQKTGKEGNERE